jgi:hypothetical protein
MGGHQSARMGKDEWLTPPSIIDALGQFDLDPCSPAYPPRKIAEATYTIHDDGLVQPWKGRVWLNPPYGGSTGKWLARLAEHGNGIALIFARVETAAWFENVWPKASAVLFIRGRLFFHHADGSRAPHNSGAPSALVAYGKNNSQALSCSGIDGQLITLRG